MRSYHGPHIRSQAYLEDLPPHHHGVVQVVCGLVLGTLCAHEQHRGSIQLGSDQCVQLQTLGNAACSTSFEQRVDIYPTPLKKQLILMVTLLVK